MAIVSSTVIQTNYGEFKVIYHKFQNETCVSHSVGNLSLPNPFVRLHSSCLFSESFQTIDCDCSLQLTKSLELIGKNIGVIIYQFQEGRGVGLADKIRAMEVERTHGIDTVEAFQKLHFELDARDYSVAIQALKALRVNHQIKLITNNFRKREQLEKAGFVVTEKVTLSYPVSKLIKKYLQVKKEKLGHEF